MYSMSFEGNQVQGSILSFVTWFEGRNNIEVLCPETSHQFKLLLKKRPVADTLDRARQTISKLEIQGHLTVTSLGECLSSSLKSLNVSRKMSAGNFCVCRLNGFQEGIMNEDVLFFCLNQVISLVSNVFQESKCIETLSVFDLF